MSRLKSSHVGILNPLGIFPIWDICHDDSCRKAQPTDDQVAIVPLFPCSARQAICLNHVIADAKFELDPFLQVINRVQVVRKRVFVAISVHTPQSQPFSLLYVS